jgi:hypothetical protein
MRAGGASRRLAGKKFPAQEELDVIYAFLILILLAGLVVTAWFALFLASNPAEAIRSVPYHEHLGPGGPDDPFTMRVPREADDGEHPRRSEQTDLRSAA